MRFITMTTWWAIVFGTMRAESYEYITHGYEQTRDSLCTERHCSKESSKKEESGEQHALHYGVPLISPLTSSGPQCVSAAECGAMVEQKTHASIGPGHERSRHLVKFRSKKRHRRRFYSLRPLRNRLTWRRHRETVQYRYRVRNCE